MTRARAKLNGQVLVVQGILLLVLLAASCKTEPAFELRALYSKTLLSTVIPSDGAVSDNGGIVVASKASGQVWFYASGASRRLCQAEVLSPIGVGFKSDSLVEIVDFVADSSEVRILTTGLDGTECQLLHRLRVAAATAAVRNVNGWVIAARPDSDALSGRLWAIDASGMVRWIVSDSTIGTPFSRGGATLASSGLGVIVSSGVQPFRSAELDDRGSVVRAFEAGLSGADQESWVGLRVLRVEGGYLQTLADPRSDRRAIVLFDKEGRRLRRLSLDVAMGLLASSRNGEYVVALRRTSIDEVVVYRALGSNLPPRRD